MENIFSLFPFTYDVASSQANEFVVQYYQRYGVYPSIHAAFAYDGLSLIAESLRKNGNSRDGVQHFLYGLKDRDKAPIGITGPLFFTDDNFCYHQSIMRTFYKGLFKPAYEQLQVVDDMTTLKMIKANPDKLEHIIGIDGTSYYKVQVVFVGIDCNRIDKIDTKELNATIDFFIWYRWMGDLNPADFVFLNNIGKLEISDWKGDYIPVDKNVSNKSDLNTSKWMSYRVKGVFLEQFFLKRFPFDSQNISILLAHKNKNANRVILVADRMMLSDKALSEIYPQEWTFLQRRDTSGFFGYDSTFGDPDYVQANNQYSVYRFQIDLKRKTFPYLLTIFVPLLILVLISLCSLLIENIIKGRIPLVVGSLLGILYFHTAILDKLPKIGYLTYIDIVLIALYSMVLLLFVEFVLLGRYAEKYPVAVKRIDRCVMYIFGCIAVVLIAVFLYLVRQSML